MLLKRLEVYKYDHFFTKKDEYLLSIVSILIVIGGGSAIYLNRRAKKKLLDSFANVDDHYNMISDENI